MTLNELAIKLEQAQDECDRLHELKTQAEIAKNAAMNDLIKAMDEAGITSFKDAELAKSFSIANDISVKKTDESLAFQWIKENGFQDAIKETIHPSTFKSIVKQHLEETGLNVPGIEVSTYQRINTRKV